MDWNREVKVGRNKISIRDLYFSIPNKYEMRLPYVDQKEKGIYVFTFLVKSVVISGNNVIVNGLVNEKSFRVIHSKRMRFMFYPNKKITLQGTVENCSCFYPSYTDLRSGLVPIYPNLPYTATDAILNNIIDDLSLRKLFLQIHVPASYMDIVNGFKQLYTIEIATILYILKSQQYKRLPLKIHDVTCTLTPNEYQQHVLGNIYQYLQRNTTMNCMLYGDVGSGKTLVGFFTAMQFVKNGYSVAFLVPTSVLASQVYEVFKRWTDDVELITGRTKKKVLDKHILVGTHALLFRELPSIGLLIIDEQHKFGVNQRNYLFHKNKCDVLMMTATPIPRTFQMITSGLMDFETLKSPQNKNVILLKENKKEVLLYVLEKAKTQIVGWVINDIEKVEEFAESLKKHTKSVFYVHSQIKNKHDILFNMTHGILVSTTVIEVGIDLDIPIIVIEKANMFGISQLHQLCGRVGRRGQPGTIIFLDKNTEKLQDFMKTTSGWERSQLDHDNRGAGTLHSILQSGQTEFIFSYTINDKGELVKIHLSGDIVEQAKQMTVPLEYVDLFAINNSL
jgi:hypothetical protein